MFGRGRCSDSDWENGRRISGTVMEIIWSLLGSDAFQPDTNDGVMFVIKDHWHLHQFWSI